MRILFDTNVVLDVLLAREPHVELAAQLLSLVERGRVEGYLCATTLTTVHYLAQKAVGPPAARQHVGNLMALFEVAPVDHAILCRALDADFADYEDAVLHKAALARAADGLVTRNTADFAGARLPVFTPSELLAALRAAGPTPS